MSTEKILFNTVTKRAADRLLPKQAEAFGLLFQLSGLVTVEVKHPDNDTRFGIVHGGHIYTHPELSELLGYSEGTFRRLFSELKSAGSIVVQRLSKGYRLATVDSYKPSKTFPQKDVTTYPWLLKSKRTRQKRLLKSEQSDCSNIGDQTPNMGDHLLKYEQSLTTQNPITPCKPKAYKGAGASDRNSNMTQEREREIESKKNPYPPSSFSKSNRQDTNELRAHPEYPEAKALVQKLIARGQNRSIIFGNAAKVNLLTALLEDPQVLLWEREVLFHVFDAVADSLPLNDDIDRTAAAGRIATGYVAALLGDGTKANARDAYFRDKAKMAATMAKIARETEALHDEQRQMREEDAAGDEFLAWEEQHGGLDCNMLEFNPSNPSVFERWQIREQISDAYAEDKKVLQQRLTKLRQQTQEVSTNAN